jgi:hypothetical protein
MHSVHAKTEPVVYVSQEVGYDLELTTFWAAKRPVFCTPGLH